MNDAKVTLIATDGGLRHVPAYLVDDLKQKGWKIVVNPKRTYYAEYDQTSPHYKKEEVNIVDDDNNILKVELI